VVLAPTIVHGACHFFHNLPIFGQLLTILAPFENEQDFFTNVIFLELLPVLKYTWNSPFLSDLVGGPMSDQLPDKPFSKSDYFDPRQKAVHSDFADGEKIGLNDVGNVGGVAVGRGSQSGISAPSAPGGGIGELFQGVYRLIQIRPDEPGVDKDELIGLVRRIEEEANKREEASLSRIENWLEAVKKIAEDIYWRTLDVLANPIAPIDLRKLALQISGGQSQSAAEGGVQTLKGEVQAGPWSQQQKDQLNELIDVLDQEILNQGEGANLGIIAHSLDEITSTYPQMRSPLYSWLVESPDIPRPVRIIARKFLIS
jgi:hypothetical protein